METSDSPSGRAIMVTAGIGVGALWLLIRAVVVETVSLASSPIWPSLPLPPPGASGGAYRVMDRASALASSPWVPSPSDLLVLLALAATAFAFTLAMMRWTHGAKWIWRALAVSEAAWFVLSVVAGLILSVNSDALPTTLTYSLPIAVAVAFSALAANRTYSTRNGARGDLVRG